MRHTNRRPVVKHCPSLAAGPGPYRICMTVQGLADLVDTSYSTQQTVVVELFTYQLNQRVHDKTGLASTGQRTLHVS